MCTYTNTYTRTYTYRLARRAAVSHRERAIQRLQLHRATAAFREYGGHSQTDAARSAACRPWRAHCRRRQLAIAVDGGCHRSAPLARTLTSVPLSANSVHYFLCFGSLVHCISVNTGSRSIDLYSYSYMPCVRTNSIDPRREVQTILRGLRRARGDWPRLLLAMPALHAPRNGQCLRRQGFSSLLLFPFTCTVIACK